MRFPTLPFSSKTSKRPNEASRLRRSRLEALETRDLLSLSPSSADYRALVSSSSFGEDGAIWVTSLDDVSNASDGKITLREALDYANQSLTGGTVSSTIRFTLGGTIKLSSTNQSLKILSKSVVVDASDVGGVTVQAQRSLAFYVYGGSSNSPLNTRFVDLTIQGGANSSSAGTAKGAGVQLAANCNLSAERCVFLNNTSSSALGAGIYAASGALSFVDSAFSQNVSTSSSSKGGAIYLEAGNLTALRTSFSNNASGEGGAIYVKSGDAIITDCTFIGNAASDGDGGALYVGAGATIKASGFRNNTSAGNGGAAYIAGENESIIVDASFQENVGVSGGAIYLIGQALSLENATLSGNKATGNGGALYIGGNSQLYASNASATGNLAALNGGVAYVDGEFYVKGGSYLSNVSDQNGGALYSCGYVEIRDAKFSENEAKDYGGGLYLSGDRRSWILSSEVSSSNAYEGGGIFNSGAMTLVNSSVSNNSATSNGGGITNHGIAYVGQSEILGNASLGANGAGGGVLNYANSQITIDDSILKGNVAESGSGGAVANNGTLELFKSEVAFNSALQYGGGIFNVSNLSVKYTTFYSNSSANGGAVSETFGSSSSYDYSVFVQNVAAELGGALYSYGAPSFQNSMIVANVARSEDYAAYYSSPSASAEPYFDTNTAISANIAAADAIDLTMNSDIVVTEINSFDAIETRSYSFGNFAINGNSASKTFSISNTGTSKLQLSNFSEINTFSSSTLDYSFTNEFGDTIDHSQSFTLDSGETIYLTITVAPKRLGANVLSLRWETNELTARNTIKENTKKAFSFAASAEISRGAASTFSVYDLEDASDYQISVKSDGAFQIALSKAPASDSILYLRCPTPGVELSSDVLLFTTTNYNTPQSVTVTISDPNELQLNAIDEITIQPQLLASDANFNGTTFSPITLQSAPFIAIRTDAAINLSSLVPAGTTRWDLNGDGRVDATTYGADYWINPSQIVGDTISYTRVRNGVTTTTSLDVVVVATPPMATAVLSTFEAAPGAVRLQLSSEFGSVASWRVNWGDGSAISEYKALSTEALFAHAYAQDGVYQISVELVDEAGVGSGVWVDIGSLTINGIHNASSALLDFQESDNSLETISTLDLDAIAFEIVNGYDDKQ